MVRVAVAIVCGELGSGKSSTISALIQQRPIEESWAVLVNEFGEVSVAEAASQIAAESKGPGSGGNVMVREVGGGCMCCVGSTILTTVLAQMLRRKRPERLLIEPSNLGEPARLLDSLLGPSYTSSLSIRAVACVVDVATVVGTAVSPERYAALQDWIDAADIVVASKVDNATEDDVKAFQRWVDCLFPPKLAVTSGLSLDILDGPLLAMTAPPRLPETFQEEIVVEGKAPQLHASGIVDDAETASYDGIAKSDADAHTQGNAEENTLSRCPPPPQEWRERPQCLLSRRGDHEAAAWIYDKTQVFDVSRICQVLSALLTHSPEITLKGVFRMRTGWFMLDEIERSTGCVTIDCIHPRRLRPVSYRRCSRVELAVHGCVDVASAPPAGDLGEKAVRAFSNRDWDSLGSVWSSCLH